MASNNKLVTRDNVVKRRELNNQTCMFCCEVETIKHVFFDCCIAHVIWQEISTIVGKDVGQDFESVACWWVSNKKK